LPRLVKQSVYSRPVSFGHAAIIGFRVTNSHRFGSQARVFGESLSRHLIKLGLQLCERLVKIALRVLVAFAMYDPP